jgi:hypothetical protein
MRLVKFAFAHNGEPCWINPDAVEAVYGYQGKTIIAIVGSTEQYEVAGTPEEAVLAIAVATKEKL